MPNVIDVLAGPDPTLEGRTPDNTVITPEQKEKIRAAFEAGQLNENQKARAIELLKAQRRVEEQVSPESQRREAIRDAIESFNLGVEGVTTPIIGGLAGLIGAQGTQQAAGRVSSQNQARLAQLAKRSPTASSVGERAAQAGLGAVGLAGALATGVPAAAVRGVGATAGKAASLGAKVAKSPLTRNAILLGILGAIAGK